MQSMTFADFPWGWKHYLCNPLQYSLPHHGLICSRLVSRFPSIWGYERHRRARSFISAWIIGWRRVRQKAVWKDSKGSERLLKGVWKAWKPFARLWVDLFFFLQASERVRQVSEWHRGIWQGFWKASEWFRGNWKALESLLKGFRHIWKASERLLLKGFLRGSKAYERLL